MANRSYRTTRSSIEPATASTGKHITARQAILKDIARNAVIDDEILAPLSMNIEVDDKGTVIVKALEHDVQTTMTTHCHRRVVRVPQEKAYQRIVDAAQRKLGLLERLYEGSRQEAQNWFNRSLITAIAEAMIIALSIFLPILLYSLQLNTQLFPITSFVIVINVINACITAWVFYQTRQAHERADLYLCSLNEVRSFATITHFIAQLNIDDRHKHLLQKTLVSTSLGLSDQQIEVEPEHYQTEPLAEE
ncbi:hypothetical protein [Dictyobacter formicarum]|uniref:SMODS and SLOG-associating 2TM effector domain-containing protein n=1 Tax=Dictyobacter formicarum TaxID=2778368 RepID=A0ABQ3VQ63_9CHLR|nr:hypothetical protein [Dictyobacter formicarum]GHO87997.1 hypothetical protein KSZ_60030 [Dictyobacter formicarum]